MNKSTRLFTAPAPLRGTYSSQRGSALITVILFSFVLLTLTGSVMTWSLTERRLNARGGTYLEARNAAEAVAEYGCYLVAQGFATRMNPTFTSSGTNPVSFPSSLASTFFAGSNVDTSSIALNAGAVVQVPSSGLHYIDPNDANNRFDPMVGRYVYRRDVTVLSKVTVNSTAGAPITAYIEEKVSVRGAPLLAYAIFYSANDLEFGQSPLMEIFGPTHVNGNLFVGPVGTNAMTFHGPVTTAGHVYHAWRGTTATSQEGGTYTINNTTAVNFSTNNTFDGAPVSMRTSAGVWNDSTMGAATSGFVNGLASLQALITTTRNTSFAQYTAQTWKGNLQTSATGITPANPMGFNERVGTTSGGTAVYATDETADLAANVGTTGLGAGYGHGYGPHSLIEPPMADPATTDTYYAAKLAIEESKFSNKAGLYLKATVNATNDLTEWILYGDPHYVPSGTIAADIGPNGGAKLGTIPSSVFVYQKYETNGLSGSSLEVTKGFYDNHQAKPINMVQIDMGALKTAVTRMATGGTGTVGTDIMKADNSTKWGVGTSGTGYDQYTPGSTGWNGGVYIDVTTNSASTHQTAVVITNGTVATGSSLMPAPGSTPNSINGLTVATNAPVYILGNLNANGVVTTTSTTNSALWPDDYPGTAITASTETPVAIAADAVTILSANYFGTAGAKPGTATNSASSNASDTRTELQSSASGDVEIAAALITGTIPTTPDGTGTQQYSGGVHNLPRFLEHFGSGSGQYDVAIRGSLVSMFNSRIQTAGWSQSYYSAPIRRWGFDQVFANGKFPPIVPRVLTYRRVDFSYISTAAAYATKLSSL